MKLKIYDASWLIHYGSNSMKYKEFSYAGYNMGGLRYLVKNIAFDLFNSYHVIVCFDSKTNNSQILEGYKNHRPFQAHILSQANFAYNMLTKSNVSCLKEDNMEADDLIASVVSTFENDYKSITIVSNDKDLAHNVSEKTSLEASSINGLDINHKNFSLALSNNIEVMYNTISAYKVFTGDSSDSIPSFKTESGKKGIAIYNDYVDRLTGLSEKYPNVSCSIFSQKNFYDTFIKDYPGLSKYDLEVLDKRSSVIYPKLIDITESPSDLAVSKNNNFAKLLTLLNEKELIAKLSLKPIKLSKEEFNEFRAIADSLNNNTFAIDNDCPLAENISVDFQSQSLNMRAF